jgi:DNA helicase-2/ATP-dependent DNA helicase PcrA
MLHGQTRYNIASRFLDEIPQDCIKWLRTVPQKAFNSSHSTWNAHQPASAAFNRQDSFGNAAWRIGQNVQHAKFGPGVVINYEGSGSDARVQVNFAQVGTKWLLVEYAKLTSG